jgi:excisionase family DNA binding protein
MQSHITPPQPAEVSPLLYDRHEAAARLSVSLRTIDELIQSRALEIVRIRRAVRIKPQALVNFIEANTVR